MITKENQTEITVVETYRSGTKSFTIIRLVKKGTKRTFYFPLTDTGKKLNSTLFARKYDAVSLGKQYFKKP